MEIGSSSLLAAGPRCCTRILILPLVLLCCPLFCCLGTAGYFTVTPWHSVPLLPTMQSFPPVVTVPAIPAIPTKTPAPGSSLPQLDPQAIPLFGSATLDSGFSPDPYSVDVEAGGSIDTSGSSPACGYTSYHPAFALDWQGGDKESFLRIFFSPNDDTGTSLLVLTPDGDWLCEQDSVLELPSAPSGEYAIWVGTQEHGTPAQGSLSITGSEDVTP